MKKYAEKTDACKCGHRFFCAEKTACRLLTNQLGFVVIILCGRAGACPRRGVRCKLTAGASPRPTLKILFR